jgi:Pvc16 N-terminal domain
MSNGLALSAVTYVLQYYLFNMFHDTGLPFASPVNVTAVAPDLVQHGLGDLSGEENQVNLFMHQVTRNAAWRNVDLPSLGADGKTRLKSPPLALDLHYLLTVYGSDDWQAEALLGYALMMLHENPVLVRADITNALAALTGTAPPYPQNPLSAVLGASGLADQLEMLKITPETLGREEMAWLWTALKADYRPSFPFEVTVVLLQPQQATSLALPVLRRRLQVQPMQQAQVLQIVPPNGQIAAAPTDTVTVTGEFLGGASQVLLSNSRSGVSFAVPAANVTGTSFSFVADAGLTHPAGIYDLKVQFLDASGQVAQSTVPVPFAIAPVLATQNATAAASGTGTLVTITVAPAVQQGQDVSLTLSQTTAVPPFTSSVAVQPLTGSTSTPSFAFPTVLAGPYLGRLQVDGVTSQVQVNTAVHPPTFAGPIVTI